MLFSDKHIIERHAGLQVQAQRHEVTWADESKVVLHPVSDDHDREQTFLRAIEHARGHWIVFDLRDVAPALAADLGAVPRAVAVRAVFHTLRSLYPNRCEFMRSALAVLHCAWQSPDHAGMGAVAGLSIEAHALPLGAAAA